MSANNSESTSGGAGVTAGREGAGAARDGGSMGDVHRVVQQRFIAAARRAQAHNAVSQAELEKEVGRVQIDFVSRTQSRHLALQQELQQKQLALQQRHARLQQELRDSIARQTAALQEDLKSNPIQWVTGAAQKKMADAQAKVAEQMAALQAQVQQDMVDMQAEWQRRAAELDAECKAEEATLRSQAETKVRQFTEQAEGAVKRTMDELLEPHPDFAHCRLSREQRAQFVRDGFVVIPQQVDRHLVDEALRLINYTIGRGVREDELLSFRRPEVEASPQVVNLLLRSPALAMARSLLGPTQPCLGGQLAVRFPGFGTTLHNNGDWDPFAERSQTFVEAPVWEKAYHVDGVPDAVNGLQPGKVHNFSLLLGVLLSDLPEEKSGNLIVYPGGHRILQEYCKTTTAAEFLRGGARGLDLPPSQQITGKAGDLIFAHYNMPHGVAPNLSPHIRHCIYFRISCVDLVQGDFGAMQDMWKHWQGVKDVL
mmetsp:Transcript_23423/g.58591  ORF Transcript_23423/g.58591 Transcript_23423/m.58591 type:complete len:483 (-) Transcript_23423:60-1508(-)